MFIDEARIMIGLDHPNVVRLYDFGQIEGAYYMAIEYVDGVDLVAVMKELSRRGVCFEPLSVAFVARELASALDHAHALADHTGALLGIVHRDISPHNVLLSHAGEVKLSDFGIAKAKNKLTHTVPGTVMGKFAYMSPEQAMAENVDARSDLFSIGVVMHEMLTSRRLFSAETPIMMITKVMESDIDPPSWLQSGVPEILDQVTLQALKREPDERFASGAEFATALDGYLQENGYGHEQFAVGDVWNGVADYHDPYHAEHWKQNEACRECVYLPMCFGGCRNMEFQRSGSMAKVDCWRDFYDATLQETILQDVRYRYQSA